MIVIAVFGLLGRVKLAVPGLPSGAGLLDCGMLLWAAVALFALMLDWRLAGPFALTIAGLYLIGMALDPGMLWTLFVVGWGAQFVGHLAFEKRRPAFLTNLVHLWVGPLWLFAQFVGYTFEGPEKS